MKFSICGYSEEVSDDELYGHRVLTLFEQRAKKASSAYLNKYNNYKSWGSFVTAAPKDGYELIGAELEFAVTILVQEGQYAISSDTLYHKYGDLVLRPWDELIDGIVDLLEKANDMADQAKYARELRKASRGQVVGGGFGISGALKGMAFAGAANLATGSVHSMVNAIGNAQTRREIAKNEEALYKNEEFRNAVCNRIFQSVMAIANCVIIEHGIDLDEVQPRNSELASSLMKNYSMIPLKDRVEVLLTANRANRYEESVYNHLICEFDGAEEAAQIGRLFGLNHAITESCSAVLSRMVPSSFSLSNMDRKTVINLLNTYRDKKARLKFQQRLPEEDAIEAAVVKQFLPAPVDKVDPADIPNLLQKIKEEKNTYKIEINTDTENSLSQRYRDAKTVNGKQYKSIEQANEVRAVREKISQLCGDLSKKSYEELLVIKEKVLSESKLDPSEYAPDLMRTLGQQITTADIARRTYHGMIFHTPEEVQQARALRESAARIVSECDLSSVDSLSAAREKLKSMEQQLEINCVKDYFEQIDTAYKKFCTYHGKTFESVEEKEQVERDYGHLDITYLQAWQNPSIQEIKQAESEVTQNSKIHPYAKELFEQACCELIKEIQQKELDAQVQKTRQKLQEKYRSLNLSDYSRNNFSILEAASKDLSSYDKELTKEILPQIEHAIQECKVLYKREEQLNHSIQGIKQLSSFGSLILPIIAGILIYGIGALAALIFLPGIWALIVPIVCIGAMLSGVISAIKNHAMYRSELKKKRLELKDLQKKIEKK